jgi:uncharacterized protein YggT (Ycf19 family)
MDFSGWDYLFNLLIAVFWFGAWGMDSRYAYFNSYLRPIHVRFESLFAFLRPALLNAPERLVALIFVLVLVVLRALVAPRTATWGLVLGIGPAGVSVPFPGDPWTVALAWSCLSVGLFFFKFWSLSCLYLGFTRRPEGQVQTALQALAAPFSWVHPAARPLVLLVSGVGLGVLLLRMGISQPVNLLAGAKALLAVVAAWAALLDILRWVVLVVIVGHWIGMGTGAQNLGWMCAEWLDHLLGPLRRYPVRIGMFDITPLIFFFGLGLIQFVLLHVLAGAASFLP